MPKFSVVSPVYNVSRYLDDFFACLERQSYGIDNLEIILVDDGSTDDSYAKCVAFRDRHPNSVTVLTQQNAGQGPARNAGLEHVTGEWVTFPDPDDVLNDDYFSSVAAYLDRPENGETALVASHLVMWNEAREDITDTHPTAFRFKNGTVTVDLTDQPTYIHGNIPISFFKSAAVSAHRLRFSDALRSRFEDGRFVSEYLLNAERPVIGLIDEARYDYRLRADHSSTVQSAPTSAVTYQTVAKHGYLHLAQLATSVHGGLPRWLQTLILYDLLWLMKSDGAHGKATRHVPAEALEEFHADIADLRKYLSTEVILGFDMMPVAGWVRESLAYGYDAGYVSDLYAVDVQGRTGLLELTYSFSGDLPAEQFSVRGVDVEPHFAKIQENVVLGRSLLHTRRVWIAAHGQVRAELNGAPRRILRQVGGTPDLALPTNRYRFGRKDYLDAVAWKSVGEVPPRFQRVRRSLKRHLVEWGRGRVRATLNWFRGEQWYDRLLAAYLTVPPVRHRYLGAWVLMDRDWNANDSAEELYRWIEANGRPVRTCFVLRKESPDWDRLQRDGFRLVPYGSFRWKALLLAADYVISSHADAYITDALPVERYGPPQWNFAFLQHGIIKGDLSRWLNRKQIDVFITSTQAEYEYIGGTSPYRYGPGQVRLTGLPRHDALLAKAAAVPAGEVTQLVIAPTWRQYLIGKLVDGSQRELDDTFRTSTFAQQWQALITSPALREVAKANGLEIVFMPHPNFVPYLDEFHIPDWVRVQPYDGVDVQQVVARTAIMITDYSSTAFNMAYLLRPTIYFQFDRDEYRTLHTEGDAYYDYERDGFGPVTGDVAAVPELLRRLYSEPDFAALYRSRCEATFPVRDGRNAERVYHAIADSIAKLSFEAASRAQPLDGWDRS